MTAIPLVFAHVLFKSWVGRFELRMKSAAHRLLFLLQNVKPAAAKGAAAASPIRPPNRPPSGAANRLQG